MKTVKVSLNRARKSAKSILDEAEELLKRVPDEGSSLKVTDIYLPLNHLFDHAAKRAFETVVHQTSSQRELKVISTTRTKVIDQVKYFGATAVGERKIFDAAQKVANTVNFYANKGYVTGVLSKLIMYQLATEPFQLERWLLLSYVSLSPEGLEYLTNNPTKVEFSIGGLPMNVEDL